MAMCAIDLNRAQAMLADINAIDPHMAPSSSADDAVYSHVARGTGKWGVFLALHLRWIYIAAMPSFIPYYHRCRRERPSVAFRVVYFHHVRPRSSR